ncbi:MAG: PLP-dependent aminotransferase family protein [Deltaproteobacteria bacterium]|nr:PLP-dependent aminotransferase family protein [Deltaproteobacteria bacterium]
MFKYEAICNYFTSAITLGTLQSGDKLPSLRQVAQQFSCAMSVCIQAFEALEYRGLILSIEKSGFFVASREKGPIPKPQVNDYSFRFAKTRANMFTARIMDASIRNDVVQLGGTIPHPMLLPLPKLQQMMNRVLKDHKNEWHQYSPAEGVESLRAEIARLMLHKGVHTTPEDIIITNGCMEALALAIQSAVGPGGVIAVESPIFFGIIVLLETLKVNVIEIPVIPQTGLDLDALTCVLQNQSIDACLLSASFQNPLGAIMPDTHKQHLIELAQRHQFAIIEDDVYGECAFNGRPTIPIKKFDTQNDVLFCSSFSKTVCPSLRIGWIIPGKQRDNCRNLKLAQTLGSPTPTQLVMAAFLKEGGYLSHMRKFQKNIARQTFQMRDLVLHHFPLGTRVTHPVGGYFLWIEYEGVLDAMALFNKALENRIVIAPGPVFGVEDRFQYAIRLSCSGPLDEKISEAIFELGKWIRLRQ